MPSTLTRIVAGVLGGEDPALAQGGVHREGSGGLLHPTDTHPHYNGVWAWIEDQWRLIQERCGCDMEGRV